MGNIKDKIWEWGFARWSGSSEWQPGYSVLLPVPSDLPVFFKLGIQTVQRQQAEHRREILVIPDAPAAAFRDIYQQVVATLAPTMQAQIRLVEMSKKDQFFRRIGDRKELFLQTINGAAQATSTHFLIHDADAFATSDDFFEQHYQQCISRNLSVIGVNPVWDEWYRQNNYGHLVATWEMMCSQTWIRQFAPFMHRGQVATLPPGDHSFDITCYTQCLSRPDEIGLFEGRAGFVHFNHVIRTYRLFTQAQQHGQTFVDEHFRLLLIRLLVDAFDAADQEHYNLPTLEDFQQSLSGDSSIVSLESDNCADKYRQFRAKMTELMASAYLSEAQRDWFDQVLHPFDRKFLQPVNSTLKT